MVFVGCWVLREVLAFDLFFALLAFWRDTGFLYLFFFVLVFSAREVLTLLSIFIVDCCVICSLLSVQNIQQKFLIFIHCFSTLLFLIVENPVLARPIELAGGS